MNLDIDNEEVHHHVSCRTVGRRDVFSRFSVFTDSTDAQPSNNMSLWHVPSCEYAVNTRGFSCYDKFHLYNLQIDSIAKEEKQYVSPGKRIILSIMMYCCILSLYRAVHDIWNDGLLLSGSALLEAARWTVTDCYRASDDYSFLAKAQP